MFLNIIFLNSLISHHLKVLIIITLLIIIILDFIQTFLLKDYHSMSKSIYNLVFILIQIYLIDNFYFQVSLLILLIFLNLLLMVYKKKYLILFSSTYIKFPNLKRQL